MFLDVGAHFGETLAVVSRPEWGFDSIVCFEPAPACWPRLAAMADDRVQICEFGLWDRDGQVDLHNPGAIGASMWADKDVVRGSTTCEVRDAAAWFRDNVGSDDTVYMKVNVEGAEVEIIRRLAEAGQLSKVTHLLVHFDVRKVPSKRHQEAEARALLDAAGVRYLSAEEIQFGGVRRGTRNWLRWCTAGRGRDVRFKVLPRLGLVVRRRLYPLKVRLLGRGSAVRPAAHRG
ncbi:FkbM family methyltransferase [Pseudonocardia lacus]|uniref:FkbM family methyltransferase n=1 Tax=Pseudonocardia lacus TaxID=2835865 RepID=UPI002028EF0A|nr:FkbM family methyltransferase [Pseudonocardia lacus]